ncbi:MAG TPA: hypothetical protein VHG28_17890, partial [Longimicrobiaceae bacterium]|nr:hypothetical protein [Longimicrobiaceae bacterium]
FGFLACRADAWTRAATHDKDVNSFWEAYKADVGKARPGGDLTWSGFLEKACKVAKMESELSKQHVPAFDLALPAGESFSCLVLEIWLSEILLTLERCESDQAEELRQRLGQRRWKRGRDGEAWGLQKLLRRGARKAATNQEEGDFPGWSLELYKTWLLLVEALDLESLPSPGGRSESAAEGQPRVTAVAVRHWYKTACDKREDAPRMMGSIRYGRLPGSFTTRGDWFLAVAPESRSYLLASRALDLLCSVRGNRNRLERGVGLPTRRLVRRDDGLLPQYASFQSPLTGEDPDALPPRKTLTYADIRALGSQTYLSGIDRGTDSLGWLWRSGLWNYHRHETSWLNWLFRMATEWVELKSAKLKDPREPWIRGFDIYRQIGSNGAAKVPAKVRRLDTFQKFPDAIRALQAELWLVDASEERERADSTAPEAKGGNPGIPT